MTDLSPSPRAALITGLATTVYYALPDVVASRTARGWLKTACVGAMVAAVVPDLREGWAEVRSAAREATVDDATVGDVVVDDSMVGDAMVDDTMVDDNAVPDDAAFDGASPGARQNALAVAGLVTVVGAAVGSVAVFERWVFRRGQTRAAAGVRFPHTRTGLVLGALTVVTALIPLPPARTAGAGDLR